MRPIDADALKEKCDTWLGSYWQHRMCLEKDIDNAPTLDYAPVVYGKWEYDAEKCEWNCSHCHNWPIDGSADDELSYYCPNCGAKMDMENDNDN